MTCNRCKLEFEEEEMNPRKGRRPSYCRGCAREMSNISRKKRLKERPEEAKSSRREYLNKNRKRINLVRNKRRNELYATDPSYNILHRHRARMQEQVRSFGAIKRDTSMKYLGCSRMQFKEHIESQFSDGMGWDNRNLWHIDHIKPCCSFDLTQNSQMKECFHYSNMRPLWAEDNIKKKDLDILLRK